MFEVAVRMRYLCRLSPLLWIHAHGNTHFVRQPLFACTTSLCLYFALFLICTLTVFITTTIPPSFCHPLFMQPPHQPPHPCYAALRDCLYAQLDLPFFPVPLPPASCSPHPRVYRDNWEETKESGQHGLLSLQ